MPVSLVFSDLCVHPSSGLMVNEGQAVWSQTQRNPHFFCCDTFKTEGLRTEGWKFLPFHRLSSITSFPTSDLCTWRWIHQIVLFARKYTFLSKAWRKCFLTRSEEELYNYRCCSRFFAFSYFGLCQYSFDTSHLFLSCWQTVVIMYFDLSFGVIYTALHWMLFSNDLSSYQGAAVGGNCFLLK